MTAEEICKSVDERLRPQAETLARSVLAMADKLEEATAEMDAESITVEYDNGGGQSGTRENPFFPAYEKLLSTYTKSIAALQEMIGEGSPTATAALDSLRSRIKVSA